VRYSDTHQFRLLLIASASIIACLAVNFVGFIQSAPTMTETRCQVFACVVSQKGDSFFFYTGSKLLSGALNFSAGLVLHYHIWRLRSGSETGQSTGRTANVIALVAVATEFCFNFLPQFMVVLVQAWPAVGLAVPELAGPYNVFFSALDSFISSFMYMRMLVKSKSATVSSGSGGHSKVAPATEPVILLQCSQQLRRSTLSTSRAIQAQ